jgi:hypothetical protein
MSFLNYQSVRPWAKAIKEAVVSRKMPPWSADPRYGSFLNDPTLKQSDIDTLAAWVDNGAPEGDSKDGPAPRTWPEGWTIQPDAVVSMPEPFPVPAKGVLELTEITVPNCFKKDTWVSAIEILPRNRAGPSCLIVAATYIWSGLAKANPIFVGTTFPWLLEPFLGAVPAAAPRFANHLGWIAPIVEFGTGVGLLTAAIGPLGRSVNVVVWPWNLAMIAFLLILFFRRVDEPAPRAIQWGRAFAFQKMVLVLFAVMPLPSLFHLWDHYLSSALYSGNINSGVFFFERCRVRPAAG